MTTLEEMGLIMARSAAAFPNSKPDKVTMQVYFELLGEIPADELKQAMDNCIKQPGRTFPPTIGELCEAWEVIREHRPSRYKQLESNTKPVYVPMPDDCRARIDAVMKKKGLKTKYRAMLGRVVASASGEMPEPERVEEWWQK